MESYNTGELIIYGLYMLCLLVLVTQFAQFGFWEMGIQHPSNAKAICATFLGMLVILIGGLLNKYGYLDLALLKKEYWPKSLLVFIGIPLAWMFFFHYVLLPTGLYDFNRAKARTFYWSLTGHFQPGRRNNEKAKLLREFSMAQKALELFDRSIMTQKRGKKLTYVTRQFKVNEIRSEYNDCLLFDCVICSTHHEVSSDIRGSNEICHCGTHIAVKRMGQILHVTFLIPRQFQITGVVTEQNRKNIAIAYSEKALLLRMMEYFEQTKSCLEEGLKYISDLLAEKEGDKNLLMVKSKILFQLGERAQTLGLKQKALDHYRQSAEIDEILGAPDEKMKELIDECA